MSGFNDLAIKRIIAIQEKAMETMLENIGIDTSAINRGNMEEFAKKLNELGYRFEKEGTDIVLYHGDTVVDKYIIKLTGKVIDGDREWTIQDNNH